MGEDVTIQVPAGAFHVRIVESGQHAAATNRQSPTPVGLPIEAEEYCRDLA